MWVLFDSNEPPVPVLKLPSADGAQLFRLAPTGDRNQVLFFTHGLDCADCLEMTRLLAASRQVLMEQNAQAYIILPQVPASSSAEALVHQGILFLNDVTGQARRSYASLFEFELPGDLMLFLLDRKGAPFRAWIGQQADSKTLIEEILRQLEVLELCCPE